jgi:hypothetical protein
MRRIAVYGADETGGTYGATIRRIRPIGPIQSNCISQHNQRKDTP